MSDKSELKLSDEELKLILNDENVNNDNNNTNIIINTKYFTQFKKDINKIIDTNKQIYKNMLNIKISYIYDYFDKFNNNFDNINKKYKFLYDKLNDLEKKISCIINVVYRLKKNQSIYLNDTNQNNNINSSYNNKNIFISDTNLSKNNITNSPDKNLNSINCNNKYAPIKDNLTKNLITNDKNTSNNKFNSTSNNSDIKEKDINNSTYSNTNFQSHNYNNMKNLTDNIITHNSDQINIKQIKEITTNANNTTQSSEQISIQNSNTVYLNKNISSSKNNHNPNIISNISEDKNDNNDSNHNYKKNFCKNKKKTTNTLNNPIMKYKLYYLFKSSNKECLFEFYDILTKKYSLDKKNQDFDDFIIYQNNNATDNKNFFLYIKFKTRKRLYLDNYANMEYIEFNGNSNKFIAEIKNFHTILYNPTNS